MPPVRKATKFNRIFDPEFLAARKDITPAMLACAQGNLAKVEARLTDHPEELYTQNKDENTMLLVAVANNHVNVASLLLDLKSDVNHKNTFGMDAVDYALMESVRSPIAHTVLAHVEYVIPDIIEGPFSTECDTVVTALEQSKTVLVWARVCGQTPDFTDIFSRDTEYRTQWLRDVNHMVAHVKKGILLLSNDIGYLERDAMLAGILDVPMKRRYVWGLDAETKVPVRFDKALRDHYSKKIDSQMLDACKIGDAMSVAGLLKAKAQPQIADARGQTVLMRAAKQGDPLVLKCLLSARANVNAYNKDGFGALLLAAVANNERAVRMLIRAKADINSRSYRGNSVLEFVRHEGHKSVLAIIDQEKRAGHIKLEEM